MKVGKGGRKLYRRKKTMKRNSRMRGEKKTRERRPQKKESRRATNYCIWGKGGVVAKKRDDKG